MPTGERLMVASFVNAMECGTEFQEWPAHLTIYPWFTLPEEKWPHFNEYMQDVIEQTVAPTVRGGSQMQFGESGDVSVRRLDQVTQTFNVIRGFDVHSGVYVAAHRFGTDWQDEYTGLHWKPHISDTPDFKLDEEQEIALDNLTVVRKRGVGSKVIRAVYNWG